MSKKILIIKLSAIGDVVHTLPCLNAIRAQIPDAKIGWVVQKPSNQILQDHPQIDHLHIYPREVWKKNKLKFLKCFRPFIKEIQNIEYDYAIDFQGLSKSGMIAKLSGAKLRIGFGDRDGMREMNGLFTNMKVHPSVEYPHIIHRNLALLEPLGIHSREAISVFKENEEASNSIQNFFEENAISNKNFVALNPGAGWITKQWPLENFAQLGLKIESELKRKVLLMWGPGEKEMVEEIERLMRQENGDPIIAPPTNLTQLIELIKHCSLFIAGDTGPTHIAAALNIPCISLFGASDSKRNHPLNQHSTTIQKEEISCVPCWKTKCKHRPIYECMRSISVDEVFEKILEWKKSSEN